MNKKIFGIKISTYIQFLVCMVVAVCIWLFAQYVDQDDAPQPSSEISSSENN